MISKSSNISAKDYELFLNYSKELGLDRTMVQAAGEIPRSKTAIQCGLRHLVNGLSTQVHQKQWSQ